MPPISPNWMPLFPKERPRAPAIPRPRWSRWTGNHNMKAMLLSEYNKLAITEMPMPDIGDDEVLVRVRACGICGSDIHGYDGSTGRRIPPIVMGHEAAGEIEHVGRNVTDYGVGDRVTFDSTVSCGRCRYCKAGQVNLCDNR